MIFKHRYQSHSNQTTQEPGSELTVPKLPILFNARGRHPNLYPVDLPDVLDESIKDELLTKFSITLLKDLVSLFDEDARAANAKHVNSASQPESVAFSLNSSMGGSIDVDSSVDNQKKCIGYYQDNSN